MIGGSTRPGPTLLLAAAGVLAAAPAASLAQAAEELAIDVAECVRLESDAERHACFDRKVEAVLGDDAGSAPAPAELTRARRDASPAPPGAAPADADTTALPTPSAEDGAQARRSKTRATARAGDARRRLFANDAGSSEPIVSAVAAVTERRPDEQVITLENGQMWRQMHSKRYPLKVGHRVRIYPTRWGASYRLTAEELSGFIQVERLP